MNLISFIMDSNFSVVAFVAFAIKMIINSLMMKGKSIL